MAEGTVTPVALCAWINEHVDAKNQRVTSVVVMEDFPRSTAGKTVAEYPFVGGERNQNQNKGTRPSAARAVKRARLWIPVF